MTLRQRLRTCGLRGLGGLCLLLVAALSGACNLIDDGEDDPDRYVYITFFDKAFEACCLESFDLDGDGRLSRYEAQRVLRLDCSGRGIGALFEIGEFTRLEQLDCSHNAIRTLDVTGLERLERLDCSDNGLEGLETGALRNLTWLDCSYNRLSRLDAVSCTSLSRLDARGNLFPTLDVCGCSPVLAADLTDNALLGVVYALAGQQVTVDGATQVIFR